MLTRGRNRALLEDHDASCVTARHLDPSAEERLVEPIPLPPPSEIIDRSREWTGLQVVRDQVEQRERELTWEVLREQDGVISRAARELGVPRTTLASRLKKLGIDARRVALDKRA